MSDENLPPGCTIGQINARYAEPTDAEIAERLHDVELSGAEIDLITKALIYHRAHSTRQSVFERMESHRLESRLLKIWRE